MREITGLSFMDSGTVPEAESVATGGFRTALKSRKLPIVLIVGYTGCLSVLLFFCHARGAINESVGVAWEFWVILLHCGLALGLIELVISLLQQEQHSLMTYPKAMFTSHLPIVSEKADTTKDVIFISIALHESETALGACALFLLIGCQCYFAWNSNTRGELLESYLPILTRDSILDQSSEQHSKGCCASLAKVAKTQALKQTSPARLRFAAAEDLPQGAAMCYFATQHVGSVFVLVCVGISALRFFLANPCIGWIIHKKLLDEMLAERLKYALCGNAPKVLSLTRMVWDATDEQDPAQE